MMWACFRWRVAFDDPCYGAVYQAGPNHRERWREACMGTRSVKWAFILSDIRLPAGLMRVHVPMARI